MTIPGRTRPFHRRIPVALCFGVTAALLVGLTTPAPWRQLFAVLSPAGRSLMMPLLLVILMETKGVGRRVGAAAGLFFATAEIGGFLGPFLLGVVRDATGSLDFGLVMLAGISVIMALTVLKIREADPSRGGNT